MAVSSKSSSKKLVRNPNQPSLKSQGAGYSTTDKKGTTTYYKSAKDAPGYSDTTQSRSNMSKGTPLSAVDSAGKAITADKLAPVNKITLPTPPAVDGMFGVQDGISAGLAGSIGGTYDTTKKAIVPGQTETPTTPPTTATSIFQNYMQSQLDGFNEQTTSESRLKEQQRMLRPKENLVNSLAGQLNTITANRDAQMLALEGQGRGQTGSFVGGEQARISREAAIQAMPVQAQLAIAQDDLESARSYASQLFQAQSQDAQNRYNFKKELNASIFNFLNDQEKTRIAQNEKALDRAFSVEQANRSNLKQLSMQAIQFGQGALAGEIMKLDPNSPTFDADLGDVSSRLKDPMLPLQMEAQRASIANSYDAINTRAEQNKALLGTINGKAQTEGEKLTQVYASRMLEANDVINSLGSKFTSTRSRIDQFLPNELLSADRQKYDQAQRNFINAVLRKESGAVISPEEFTSAKLQYFPQPGDSAGVITQKQNNRSTALTGLYNAANVPMPELVQPDAVTPLKSGYKGVTTSGITYTIE